MSGMDRNTGRAIDGNDHLRQSIADILSTPIGTRVMPARDYGSMLPDLVDQPLNSATRLLIYAATLIAGGMPIERALQAAVVEPLTDEPDVAQALRDVIAAVYG